MRGAKSPQNQRESASEVPSGSESEADEFPLKRRDIGQMRRRRGEVTPSSSVRTATLGGTTRQVRTPQDPASISTKVLAASLETWLLECEGIRRLSPLTIRERRSRAGKLLWFLKQHDIPLCDREAIARFFTYLRTPLKPGEARWGTNGEDPIRHNARKPVSAKTAKNYWMVFSAWFQWLIRDGKLEVSPLAKLDKPQAPQNSPQPFTVEQLARLFEAAKRSNYPVRDQAILALMLDTGIRTCELIALNVEDVDLDSFTLTVTGKGSKVRQMGFGSRCRTLLLRYIEGDSRYPSDPLFVSQRGRGNDGRFTNIGLGSLYARLGERAGLTGVRCSPHTMRHAFATLAIKTGRLSEFTLQNALGHTTLSTTLIYSKVARADVIGKMRSDSPLDLVLGKLGRGRKEG